VARNLGRSKIGFTEPVSMSCKMPALVDEKIELGVAYTGFFIPSAHSTVIKLPDFSPASGRNSTSDNQAIKRFLWGKLYFSGLCQSLYSEITSPPSATIFSINARSGLFKNRHNHHHNTAMVGILFSRESL